MDGFLWMGKCNNQPKVGHNDWLVRGDGAQGDDHGGKSCCSFSAIDVSGAKKNKSKCVVI